MGYKNTYQFLTFIGWSDWTHSQEYYRLWQRTGKNIWPKSILPGDPQHHECCPHSVDDGNYPKTIVCVYNFGGANFGQLQHWINRLLFYPRKLQNKFEETFPCRYLLIIFRQLYHEGRVRVSISTKNELNLSGCVEKLSPQGRICGKHYFFWTLINWGAQCGVDFDFSWKSD